MHAQVIEAVQAVLAQGEGEESAAAVGLPVSHDRGCLTDLSPSFLGEDPAAIVGHSRILG